MKFGARQFDFCLADPPVVIGEIGVNHNGDIGLARKLVDVAVDSDVDIIKLQVFKTEESISRAALLAPYQKATSCSAQTQYDLCKPLELSQSEIFELNQYCEERRIGFLCSVFDFESIDFVISALKAEVVKVASGEVTNLPLLEYIGKAKASVILSTGACTPAEIGRAIETLKQNGCPEIVLLHCVSSYPAPGDQLNLRAMQTLAEEFRLPVGFSDHSLGIEAAIAAAALNAVAIEKHFTLDCNLAGPDHRASLEPHDLKRMVKAVRFIHAALGDGVKRVMACEIDNLPLIRKGLVANGPLQQGIQITRAMVRIKRPADGIDPGSLNRVLGRTLARGLGDDEPIRWKDLV